VHPSTKRQRCTKQAKNRRKNKGRGSAESNKKPKLGKRRKVAYESHLKGISWKVPSGRVLRIVMGKMPASSSDRAMSMGFVFSAASTKIGAPIEI
jgi:hypothetical protein